MSLLVVCASARECENLEVESVVVGVGKAAAAARLTTALASRRPAGVLLFGVCGAYPSVDDAWGALMVGDLCLVGTDVFADEGVETPSGFESIADLGLGEVGPFEADEALTKAAAMRLKIPIVAGATVSTCSGTQDRSVRLATATSAQIETMEGAAVALVCREAELPLVHLRCVSNLTGDRDRAGWDLDGAIERVQAALVRLVEAWP